MTRTPNDPLSAADLDANRAGKLTDDQRRGLAGFERGVRKERVMMAVIFAVIAGLVLISNGGKVSQTERLAVGGGLAVVAVLLFVYGTIVTDAITRDLRAGRVAAIEGPIGKDRQNSHSGNSSHSFYFLEVGGRRLEVAGSTYDAAPDAGYVRVYVLPRSNKVVNFERLPDPPVTLPDAAQAPGVVGRELGAMAAGWLTGDFERKNEARAQMEAMGDALRAQVQGAATPPPAGARDPRPLAEAIVGEWKTPFMSVTFAGDGTVVATLPGGRRQQGRWSVGPDGKLRSNALGRDEAAEAWVAGDTLTISDGSQGMAFHRAG